MINYHITVKGRVQGVGYRSFASRLAGSLGLTGYVMNKQDGSVFIEAEGDKSKLDLFVEQCKVGPGWAYVDDVSWEEYPVQGLHRFNIKY